MRAADGGGSARVPARGRGDQADADQAASDADQAASDADQAASDAESGAATTSPAESEQARRSGTLQRQAATIARARTTRARDHEARKSAARDRRHRAMAQRLRQALDGDGFALFAQPIVDLSTDRVSQHELLIRMRDPRGGLLQPSEFIPVAERFGLIPEMDRWTTRRGVGLAARGHAVHVNVSAPTLADPSFGADVERALRSVSASGQNLVFEVTETALIRNEPLAVRFFERVRALGCRVAIDDFGSGYGGLHYIKRFSVDFLKIDQEFVTDLATEPDSAKVVDSVVRLARDFELETVAEGVEDATVLERLRALQITHAQGYLCGRPVPAADVLSGATT